MSERDRLPSTPTMAFEDLRAVGVLWYINRVAFHPRGLRLALHLDDEGQATGWSIQRDTDPPSSFDPAVESDLFRAFEATLRTIPVMR